ALRRSGSCQLPERAAPGAFNTTLFAAANEVVGTCDRPAQAGTGGAWAGFSFNNDASAVCRRRDTQVDYASRNSPSIFSPAMLHLRQTIRCAHATPEFLSTAWEIRGSA